MKNIFIVVSLFLTLQAAHAAMGECFLLDSYYLIETKQYAYTATSVSHQEHWQECYAAALRNTQYKWGREAQPYIMDVALEGRGVSYEGEAVYFISWRFEPNPTGMRAGVFGYPKGQVTKYSSKIPAKGNQKFDPHGNRW